MIYTFKSSKSVIAKVFRDLRIQDSDWVYDAVEWIGESLDAIGSFAQLRTNSKVIPVYSFSASLPKGLVVLNSVFYSSKENPTLLEDFDKLMQYGSHDGHPAYVETEEIKKTPKGTEEFIITGGYIKTSIEEGKLLISYQEVATDKDGFPLIPDDYSFDQAIYWYIVHKLMEGGFEHPAKIHYFDARNLWLNYCTQARNAANYPDSAQYEKFQKMWVGLLPPTSVYDNEKPRMEIDVVDASNLVTKPLTVEKDD